MFPRYWMHFVVYLVHVRAESDADCTEYNGPDVVASARSLVQLSNAVHCI